MAGARFIRWPRLVALAAVFVLGSALALAVVGRVALPFRNPHDALAPLVERRFAPGTNVLRYLVVVGAPAALLGLLALSRRARGLLLAAETAVAEERVARADARVLPALLAYAVLCGLATPTYHAEGEFDPLHEGEALALALRLEDGGAPYADVAVPHGAFQDPLRALAAFHLFGHSIGAVRTLESLVKVATFVLLGVFLLRLRPRHPGFAFGALGVLTLGTLVPRYGLIVAPRELLPATFLLLALELLRETAGERERRVAVLAFALGAVGVLAFGHSVDRGWFVAALAALVLALAALAGPAHPARSAQRALRILGASAAGVAAGSGALALLLGEGRGGLVDHALVQGPALAAFYAGLEYDWSRTAYVAPVLLVSALAFGTFARFLARVAELGPRAGLRRFVREDPGGLVLVLAALVFYRGALVRGDAEHVRYSLWLAFVYVLHLVYSRGWPRTAAARRLALVAGVALAGFLGAWVAARGRIAANFPIGEGDAHFLRPEQQEVVRALTEELAPDDVFANLTYEPGWYYLVDRVSPTRHAYLGTANSAAERRELLDELVHARVDVVLARASGKGGIDRYPDRRRQPEMHGWLDREFVVVRAVRGLRILRRVDEAAR